MLKRLYAESDLMFLEYVFKWTTADGLVGGFGG